MASYKRNKIGLWDVQFYCKSRNGDNRKYHKCNFPTKKAAAEYVEQFKLQQKQSLDMTFASFVEIYFQDMESRLRVNTMRSKRYVVELKLLPYFGKMEMSSITAADIRKWQNEMMKEGYAQTYLKTINNQLSAIFNYACRYYDLLRNPCRQAGTMGKSNAEEMKYWTQEEFEQFLEAVQDKPVSYYAFLTLYWTGLRLGELLALQLQDFDCEAKTISVTKSLQRINGEDVVTEPKTEKSKRVITLPDFLVEQLQEYTEKLYGMMAADKLFMVTKSYLEKEIVRGAKLAGVPRIRLHDLRHSHASMLISKLDAPPKLVADRLGHEKIQTTLNTYSHLYPDQSRKLADQLDQLVQNNREGEEV